MTDAISVLGSRHNITIEPGIRKCYVNRCGLYPGFDCEIVAGVEIDGRTVVFPLCEMGDTFDFVDQDMTPCTMQLTGVDSRTIIKLELTITTPFRPRDAVFSTMPILDIRLKLSRLESNFRGFQAVEVIQPGKVFFQINSSLFKDITSQGDRLYFGFDTPRPDDRKDADSGKVPVPQNDVFFAHRGIVKGPRVELEYTPDDYIGKEIHISWCSHSQAIMEIFGKKAEFKYTEKFSSLDDVVDWVIENPDTITDNAKKVDGIIAANNLSVPINNLLAQTLHSWMINTWWTKCDGKDWFNVWEGNCYYLSTMDVEYTQSPYYLSVWPELLALQLDMWPHFTHNGKDILGDKGRDTVVFMHDVGWLSDIATTKYSHPMPVEQNANYTLMSYAYWRRTGDFSVIKRNIKYIAKALDFIVLSDSTGDGVPDKGTANTIDDACPALQFGKGQVYLAVKSIAALEVGAEILECFGDDERVEKYREQVTKARNSLLTKGWNGDHFNVLLEDDFTTEDSENNGGCDASHIYTSHGLTLLEMVGTDVGIPEDKLKMDIVVAAKRCLDRYGCKHTDYVQEKAELLIGEFGTFNSPRVGWISMNMFRDIFAFYRGIDMRDMACRYWQWQTLVNTQGPCLFFETFNGNRLMNYPRGIAIFGFFDALGGIKVDAVKDKFVFSPLNAHIELPVLLFADWKRGIAPKIKNSRIECFDGLIMQQIY